MPDFGQFYRQIYPGVAVRGYYCPPAQRPYWNTIYLKDFPEEYPLLEDFLYDAIYIPEGMESCTYYPQIVLSCKAGLLTGTPGFKQLCRLQKQNPYIREKILRKAIGSVWPGMP